MNIKDLPGMVTKPSLHNLPSGYIFRVTKYADVILESAFPQHFTELMTNFDEFFIDYSEISTGGGGRAPHTRRFDEGLYRMGWQKKNITISKQIDDETIYRVRNHEIDVFKLGKDDRYPGIAVEMEWNNKDPFFHRDLNNFSVLHKEGVIAVGVIVTRGPALQRFLESLPLMSGTKKSQKYGKATTHWDKLIPMVNIGGGGECPLLLVGIEPPRLRHIPREQL